ncbi:MAG: glycoside hydrolase family 76 protein [Alistipes onderdonkii]
MKPWPPSTGICASTGRIPTTKTRIAHRCPLSGGNIFLQYTYAEGAGLRADEWKGALMSCYQNLERHWSPDYKGIAGYCTLPVTAGTPDRYYDENGWMAIGLARAYEQTGDRTYLEKARQALNFTMSGEDDVLGGGIYFQETFAQYEPQKNTICSAVAILASMKLYELTNEQGFLEDARRIEEWTRENLLSTARTIYSGTPRWSMTGRSTPRNGRTTRDS